MNGNNEEKEKKKKRILLILLLLLLLLVIVTGAILVIKLVGFTDVTPEKGGDKDIDTITIVEPGDETPSVSAKPAASVIPSAKPEASETPSAESSPTKSAKKKPEVTATPTQGGGGGGSTASPSATPSVTPSPSATPTPSATPSPEDTFEVIDGKTGKSWTQLSTIDIFKDGVSVAPGSTGSYEFRVVNGISGDAFFTMRFEEESHASGAIPFEYRLKCGSNYVTGDKWLTAEEMGKIKVALNESGSITYTLEWRWPYERGTGSAEKADNNSKDTALGVSGNREHKLTVKITASAVN